ncbi:MAG: ABC transporter ATP-binding protein [Thermoprotei archaeon]|nr:MAG: ABC transporter ATP-binding protein [Thermoprotei archaeon]
MSLTRLWPYALRYKKYLILAAFASLASSAAAMVTPLLAREAVNAVVEADIESLPWIVAGIIALACFQGLLTFIGRINARRLAEMVTLDLRVDLYRKLQDLSLTYLYREGAGKLVARVTGDVEQVKRLFMFGLSAFLSSVLLLVLALSAMISISLILSVVSLAVLVPSAPLVKLFAKKIRAHFEKAREEYAKMTSVLQEALVGMIALRAVGAEKSVKNSFAIRNKLYSYNMISVGKFRAMVWPTLTGLTYGALLIAYWIGGLGIIEETLTVGDLVAFAMYVSMVSWPISSLGLFTVVVEMARVAASRVFEVIDVKTEVEEAPDAVPLRIERGEVRFENVWFSYSGENWILKGLNLTVKPGEFIAITGSPGSGKSTLALLALRFFDPQQGRVVIDGMDIRKVTLESLRRQVAVVHQDVYLFPDTIKNNIAYAKPGASEEEVIEAAKLARIHDFIKSLPRGYDTLVGERGVTLSGGQRQRVALARTLLSNPKIVLLDDTTSEIDAETERAIYEALTNFLRGKTLIVITQRPSTMALADRVVVVKEGRIVREGRPEEIMGVIS